MKPHPSACALLGALAGCTPDFRVQGNPTIPLDLDLSTGVPTTRMAGSMGLATATLDTGSPLSGLGMSWGCSEATAMELHSAAAPDRVRWVFLDEHPVCVAGDSAVVGGDLLARYEVIFASDLSDPGLGCSQPLGCVQLLPGEIEPTRDLGCEGYVTISFRLLGGGTYLDARGRKVDYLPTRVPLRVCVDPPLDYVRDCGRQGDPGCAVLGRDATLLLATGVQPLVVSSTAATRLGLELSGAPPTTLALPGSPAPGVTATPTVAIDRIAIVGQTVGDRDPGPCFELQRSRCLAQMDRNQGLCNQLLVGTDNADNTSDAEGYIVLLDPTPAVTIADETPYLQSARDEVRPRIADADGFLGTQVLTRLPALRIDYRGVSGDEIDTGPRVITRCAPGTQPNSCQAAVRRPITGSACTR